MEGILPIGPGLTSGQLALKPTTEPNSFQYEYEKLHFDAGNDNFLSVRKTHYYKHYVRVQS